MSNPTDADKEGFYASVEQKGRLHVARVFYQHPAGETNHYTKTYPFFWLAKIVSFLVASAKKRRLYRNNNAKYWEHKV